MSRLQFQHFHSFQFASETGIPWIVRTGWLGCIEHTKSAPTFIWKRFHRLVDVVRFWFQVHSLPLQYPATDPKTKMVMQVMFFRTVVARLATILHLGDVSGILTLNEMEAANKTQTHANWEQITYGMQVTTVETVDTKFIVDDDKIQTIFDMFVNNPMYFFGNFFAPPFTHYQVRSAIARTNMQYSIDSESLHVDVYLQTFYQSQGYPNWPIAFDTAMHLAAIYLSTLAQTSKATPQSAKETVQTETSQMDHKDDWRYENKDDRAEHFRQLRLHNVEPVQDTPLMINRKRLRLSVARAFYAAKRACR